MSPILDHPLAFPKLVSLTLSIMSPDCGTGQTVQFPVLDSLTISGDWGIFPQINAPKLTRLALQQELYSKKSRIASKLRRATARPTSLSITDDLPELHLIDLLSRTWPTLRDLHWESSKGIVFPGPAATVALAGDEEREPLCPELRYFTVHMDMAFGKVVDHIKQTVDRLGVVVRRRESIYPGRLQRVYCSWTYAVDLGSAREEWIDVL